MMNVNVRSLTLLDAVYQTKVFNGALWRSLELNPYSIFDADTLLRLRNAVVAHKWPKEDSNKLVPVFNLRVIVKDSHASALPNMNTVVLSAHEVSHAQTCGLPVVVVTLVITANHEPLIARQLRTSEIPLAGAMLTGFLPMKKLGTH